MGYRTYIGSMPKEEYDKVKSLKKEEFYEFHGLKNEDEDDEPHLGDFSKQLYEFGKYTDFNPPKGSMKRFFESDCLKERYEDYDIHVVTKEFLSYIIEGYRERVAGYYNDMFNTIKDSDFMNSIKPDYKDGDINYKFDFSKIKDEEQTALYKIIEHIRSFRTEWSHLTPYDLERGDCITTSWKYEYGIFELVRIYKSFDWDNNVMIYYGY